MCKLRMMGVLANAGEVKITNHFSSTSESSLPVERPKDNSNSQAKKIEHETTQNITGRSNEAYTGWSNEAYTGRSNEAYTGWSNEAYTGQRNFQYIWM